VVRPAAYEQLCQLSEQIHVPFYGEKGGKNAAEIARNGLQKVKAEVYIIDSSGRDALDEGMINEIKAINAAVSPDERILVIPADIGQAARVQAEAFQKALGITGVIITKLDGTAKGGGALTACATTGAPVKWIGTGEKLDAFEVFEPDRFVSRLIGWGDIQSLVEKAK
jgi:signal recognition particle subunit SRP54